MQLINECGKEAINGVLEEIEDVFFFVPEFVWSQEEGRNAGAWSFVRPRFENALGISPVFAGRPEMAWTATAIGEHHAKEAEEVIRKTFEV
ncbi:hypothetical protein ANCCAN_03301 [Ancylostoma caninum]|uniref:2-oxoglutarate dehydrogenase E1 component/KDG C-terminal domain-containing protein n=1 Tax=Ancylostoma caninum TaxID=29170 RepID=A0A368H4J6_ANCCA|nr:hypothetical protein ANCCAN_03301 [Ancylostoma caninum]